ncbi:hypothetical protein IKN40_02340 [bacterium]|nr:hypothetical protein [bacterium]
METEHFEFDLAENRVDFSYETALLRAITEGERDLYDDPVVVDQIYKSVDDLKRDNLHRESIDLSTRR